jgi:hypothetical protein
LLHLPRQAGYVAAILALGLYLFNIVQVKAWHEARADRAELYTYDFIHILEKIDGKNKNINMPEAIPYGPFPPGLYLSEHYLTSPEIADFVVTRNRKYPAVNLTPDNQIIFLFENSTPD